MTALQAAFFTKGRPSAASNPTMLRQVQQRVQGRPQHDASQDFSNSLHRHTKQQQQANR
jgi:hypothetical protein